MAKQPKNQWQTVDLRRKGRKRSKRGRTSVFGVGDDSPPATPLDPPQLAGGFANQTFEVLTGPWVIDLSTDLSGGDPPSDWTISGLSATVDSDGLATIPDIADPTAATTITYSASNSGGSSTSETFDVEIVAATVAPSLAGGLADLTFTVSTGPWVIDLSADLNGGDPPDSWTVSGLGATVDAAGLATIPDIGAPTGPTSITYSATNTGGTSATRAFQVTVTDVTLSVTLTEYTRSGTIIDGGAAFNRAVGLVPFTGTTDASDGTQLEARTLYASDSAEHTPWADLTTAAAGAYFGYMSVSRPTDARSDESLLREVRVKNQPSNTPQSTVTFVIGHVVDVWGQSEQHRIVLTDFGAPASPPAITDPTNLRITFSDNQSEGNYGTELYSFLIGSGQAAPFDKVEARLAEASNLLAAERPGEKMHIVFHTLSGSSITEVLDDANTGRQWSQDATITAFALPEAEIPGLAFQSWHNADSSLLQGNYGDYWMRAISGLNPDGSPHTAYDHYFTELYGDYTNTMFAIGGPHRFDMQGGFDNNIPLVREALDAAFENPIMFSRARRVMEMLTYENGGADGSDTAHPSASSADGLARHATLMMYSILQGLELGLETPELDRWFYDAGADQLRIGCKFGKITTTRIERAEALGAGRPVIFPIQKNGVQVIADDLAINAEGEIVVSNVNPGDTIILGPGGIGTDTLPDDLTIHEVWKDYPIVDRGQEVLEGLPVRGYAIVPDGLIPAGTAPVGYNQANSDVADGQPFREGIINTWGTGGWKNGTTGAGSTATFWPDDTNSDETFTLDCADNGLVIGVCPDASLVAGTTVGQTVNVRFYVTGTGTGTLEATGLGAGNGLNVVFDTQSIDLATQKGTLITLSGVVDAAKSRLEVHLQMSPTGSGTITVHTPTVEIV